MNDDGKDDVVGMVAAVLWDMPVLMLRVCVSYMRTKRRMRKAVRSFSRSIRAEGLPPEVADSLCSIYDEGTSIFRQVFSSLIRGMPMAPK